MAMAQDGEQVSPGGAPESLEKPCTTSLPHPNFLFPNQAFEYLFSAPLTDATQVLTRDYF